VDPLASKYPGVSPYAFCFSNPINFIDFNGEEPTAEEAALMAKHAYGDEVDLKGDWKVSERDFGINYTNCENGFKSQLYERTIDGKTEYVYAFAGTDGLDAKDWKQNGLQLIGKSSQYSQSYNNTERIIENIGNNELTLIGHSLGGGLASYSAIKTGNKAITFNSAGLSPMTLGKNKYIHKNIIDAYILETDPLNIAQTIVNICYFICHAISTPPGSVYNQYNFPFSTGKKYLLPAKDIPSVLNGHSINNVNKSF
jgi:hypothetical protein